MRYVWQLCQGKGESQADFSDPPEHQDLGAVTALAGLRRAGEVRTTKLSWLWPRWGQHLSLGAHSGAGS